MPEGGNGQRLRLGRGRNWRGRDWKGEIGAQMYREIMRFFWVLGKAVK